MELKLFGDFGLLVRRNHGCRHIRFSIGSPQYSRAAAACKAEFSPEMSAGHLQSGPG
jgi:hypothetical protein